MAGHTSWMMGHTSKKATGIALRFEVVWLQRRQMFEVGAKGCGIEVDKFYGFIFQLSRWAVVVPCALKGRKHRFQTICSHRSLALVNCGHMAVNWSAQHTAELVNIGSK